MTTITTKIWKERPPGPEQIELQRMFKCNEIDPRATPDSVRNNNVLFKGFSSQVFGNHFRATKAKLGLSASVANVSAASGSSAIHQEVTGVNGFFSDGGNVEETEWPTCQESDRSIAHINPPSWAWAYTDHEKKKDFVCVALPAVVGKNATFVITEDGTQIKIKYEWPSVMFNANMLFEKSVGRNGCKLAMNHPKVHSFVSHLLSSGATENSTLNSERNIDLPKKIQREKDSWTVEKVVVGDTKMLLLEFTAFQNNLIINDADTSHDFKLVFKS